MGATERYEGARPRGGVRLTRRGRIVVIAAAVALLLTAFWLGAHQASAASAGAVDTPHYRVATVPRGGTVWEIAVAADPDADPRVTVRRIMDLNGLSTAIVQPGERLKLPPPS